MANKVLQERTWLTEKFSDFAEKTCVVCKEQIYSYQSLLSAILSARDILTFNKVTAGQVVGLVCDYSFESIALFLALLENKNIIVPITSIADREVEDKLKESFADQRIELSDEGPRIVALENKESKHQLIKNLQQEEAAGLVLFTSGSTGKPKALIHNLDKLLEVYKNKKQRDLVILLFLMFDHIGGLNTLLTALAAGFTAIIPEERDAEHIACLIEKHKVTLLPTTPTFLNLMLISEIHKRYNLRSLRMITYGTEIMPEKLLKKLRSTFHRVKFLQTFGTSETGIARTISGSQDSTVLKIDDPNTEYKIVDGELWLKSRTQMLGYLNYDTDSVMQDHWYRTGDLVEQTGDGFIRIIGRTKEIINVGGQKVLPAEVESVLHQLPEIVDCMVYGEANAILGQIVTADIVVKEANEGDVMRNRIKKFCADMLDGYKIPVRINIVDQINITERFKKVRPN